MLLRNVMLGVGMTMALGCSSNIDVGTNDAGMTPPQGDAGADRVVTSTPPQFLTFDGDIGTDGGSVKQASTDAATDGASALQFTSCTFTSDAGAPTCYAFAPWTTNAAETAQAQLDCMNMHGAIVGVCPSAGLVGCCSLPLCPPPPPGQSQGCAFFGPDQPGMNVTCSYGEDAGTAHVQDLTCVAGGGTWTTTVPQ